MVGLLFKIEGGRQNWMNVVGVRLSVWRSFDEVKVKGQSSQVSSSLGKVRVSWPERLALLTRSNFEMSSWD